MSFNERLLHIHQNISIKDEDRQPYTHMYDTVRDWLMKEMRRIDPLFNEMFKGTELFGSYPNNVRIIKPNEYDVSILLQIPYPLQLVADHSCPSFVKISSNHYPKNAKYYKIFTDNCLDRFEIRKWIKTIIESVVNSPPGGYSIKYTPTNIAHTFYVVDVQDPKKTISIDFVPSIVIRRQDIAPVVTLSANDSNRGYMEHFLAIPQVSKHIAERYNSNNNVFQLGNKEAERDKIWNKQNLKVVYRLLKSMRDKHDLPRLKSYFFTAIFLLEVDKQSDAFWHRPVAEIFVHMLKQLLSYFEDNNLPFYWQKNYNLLSILRCEERMEYERILRSIYSQLQRFSPHSTVDANVVYKYFQIP